MTIRKTLLQILAGFALATATSTQAATVSLNPSAASVLTNDLFSVVLSLNATDAPGTHPGLYMGNIVIDFDPARLSYQGFTFQAPVTQKNAPVTGTANGRQTVTLGFQNATDISTIGTFSFRAIGSAGQTASIGLADADDFFGTFIATLPTNQPFYPEFQGTSVAIVPLPATAWLLLTGFALVGARARRGLRRSA